MPSNQLQKVEVTVPGNCAVYGTNYNSNYMICAGLQSDNGGPCPGDEGSPLIQDLGGLEHIAVGLVSKTSMIDGECRKDPYYSFAATRLDSYVAWIRGIAGTQPGPGP